MTEKPKNYLAEPRSRLAELAGYPSVESRMRVASASQPKWVPEWVWGEAHQYPFYSSENDKARWEAVAEYVDKIVLSEEMKAAWPVFERRRDEANRIWHEMIMRVAGGISLETARQPFAVDAPSVIWMIADASMSCVAGFKGHHTYTNAQRRSVARKIDKSISDLLGVLTDLQSGTSSLPYPMRQGVVGSVDVFEILSALRSGANSWGEKGAPLARPNDPNATRLLLIRSLTGLFRSRYETPLREAVLATTSVFFDCNDLDASAVAKLAP